MSEERAVDPDWHRTFFRGMALDVWQLAAAPEQTAGEAAFLERVLGARPGARLLDVACGLGRHAIELAARGCDVTASDGSAEAIGRARALASARGVAVEWVVADVREPPPRAPYDGAWCLGNSFGYLDPGETRRFLAVVAGALRPGARFVLDAGYVAESLLTHFEPRQVCTIGDVEFLEENVYHLAQSCVETRYTFTRCGTSETRVGWQWVFTLREIVELLAAAGFEVEQLLQSPDGTPYAVGAPCLLLVARKRG